MLFGTYALIIAYCTPHAMPTPSLVSCRLPDFTICACYSKPWTAQNRWRFTVRGTSTHQVQMQWSPYSAASITLVAVCQAIRSIGQASTFHSSALYHPICRPPFHWPAVLPCLLC
jgi:hypothetical protein